MYHLFPLIISLMLAGYITVSSISYIPAEAELAREKRELLVRGFEGFEQGFERYQQAKAERRWYKECPPDQSSQGECVWETSVRTDSQPPSLEALTNEYMFKPAAPGDWRWSWLGRAACVEGPSGQAIRRAAATMKRRFGPDRVRFAQQCQQPRQLQQSVPDNSERFAVIVAMDPLNREVVEAN